MEPKFQTSFIPKKSVSLTGGMQSVSAKGGADIFSVIAVVVFVLTLAVCGGLFAYQKVLKGQILQAQKDLVSAETAFEPEVIQQVIDSSGRISSAKKLLKNHIVASPIFEKLQVSTLKRMRFSQFSYKNPAGKPSISLSGEALSYNSLTGQSELFSNDVAILNPEFSDFHLSDLGMVTFKFSADIDPALASYEKNIGSFVSQ